MKKAISLLLSLSLMVFILYPTPVEAMEEPLPRYSSMSSISQSVYKSGNGVTCYYNARAYSNVTKIVVACTLYEMKNGSYVYADSWSNTHDTFYGYAESYRSTSGGSCMFVATYTTYINGVYQERISVTRYT